MKLLNPILKRLHSLVLLFVFVLSSCNGSDTKGVRKEEGVMKFETIAVDKNDPLFDLAPSAATLKF